MKCMQKKYRKQQLLNEINVPTQSEVRRNLGGPLAEIFFKELDEPGKQLMGLTPPLQAPDTTELWMSPSDVLNGKVLLTPPMPTRRVVRALTHDGIIEIGSCCMYKFQNEERKEKERSLLELEARLKILAAQALDRAVQEARDEEKLIHDQEVQALLDLCDAAIGNAVEEKETILMNNLKVRNQAERKEIHDLMEDQMEAAVKEKEETLTEMFKQKLEHTIDDMNNHYHTYIRMLTTHFDWQLQQEVHKHKSDLKKLQSQLLTENSCDVAYAICIERQNCLKQKQELMQEFNEKIAELQKVIDSKIVQIEEEQSVTRGWREKCSKWETRVREIVREFQKFINFALKAVPGQAQFLLSLEKLLVLEIQKPKEPELPPKLQLEESEEIAQEQDDEKEHDTEKIDGGEEGRKEGRESTVIFARDETKEKEVETEKEETTHDPADKSQDTLSGESLLEPIMQMTSGLEESPSEEMEIVTQVLGDLVSNTTSIADFLVHRLVDDFVKKAVPPNTDKEEIIGRVLEKLILDSTPLALDVVAPIVDKLLKSATPIPEGEIAVLDLLNEMVETAMGPEMFDASTQAPASTESIEMVLQITTTCEQVAPDSDTHKDTEGDDIQEERHRVDSRVTRQECGWCEIKEKNLTKIPGSELFTGNVNLEPGEPTPELETTALRPEDQSFQERGLLGEGGKEHEQPAPEFVADRIQSLLKILHENPSVAKIFLPHFGT